MTYRARFGFDWPTFAFRVNRGAYLLDQVDREWAENLDLAGFTMPIAIHPGIPFSIPGEPTWRMRSVERLIERAVDPKGSCCPGTALSDVGFACADPFDCRGLVKAWRRKIASRQRIAREHTNGATAIEAASLNEPEA
jgi:hypothetical protein